MTEIADRLREARVIPVVRTSTAEAARRAVGLLRDEGFALFEITLTTPGALGIIGDLAGEGGVLVGAGTVLDTVSARAAIDAGAGFIVSPAGIDGLIASATAAGIPVALGAATPTEVLHAHRAGANFVKIFPAAQLGGPGFVKALGSVFPDIALMPTGGIGPGDIAAYLAAGAVCLGIGGTLVSDAALGRGDDRAIREAARQVMSALVREA